MKKKLYFDDRLNFNIEFYVEIEHGKIKHFVGANMHDMLLSDETDEVPIFDLHVNSDFVLEKLSDYDKKKLGTTANYIINSKEISNYTLRGAYIKLNLIEHTLLKFAKKETVLHRMKINEKIANAVIISIPLILIGYGINNFGKLNTNSPKPSLNTIYHDTINPTKKAKTHSTKQEKLALDSLSRK